MATVLLSIKPKYVEKIFDGIKKYEYRKIKYNKNIDKVIIYATLPVKRVVGEATVKQVIVDTPSIVWENTKQYSGTTEKEFMEYYKNTNSAIVLELIDVVKYDKPKILTEYGVYHVPQSFVYLK